MNNIKPGTESYSSSVFEDFWERRYGPDYRKRFVNKRDHSGQCMCAYCSGRIKASEEVQTLLDKAAKHE